VGIGQQLNEPRRLVCRVSIKKCLRLCMGAPRERSFWPVLNCVDGSQARILSALLEQGNGDGRVPQAQNTCASCLGWPASLARPTQTHLARSAATRTPGMVPALETFPADQSDGPLS